MRWLSEQWRMEMVLRIGVDGQCKKQRTIYYGGTNCFFQGLTDNARNRARYTTVVHTVSSSGVVVLFLLEVEQ